MNQYILYFLKVNIGRTGARLEDERTDERNIFRTRNRETRRPEIENFGRLVGRPSSCGRTIANPASFVDELYIAASILFSMSES